MDSYLEVSSAVAGGRRHLTASRVVIGRSPDSDVVLTADAQVSRTHAVLERVANRWILRDVGSRNGTYLNGQRVRDRVPLRHGDEIRIGKSVLVLKAESSPDGTATERQAPAPSLTVREREVLLAVLRPLVSGSPFGQPATTPEIARTLWVSDAAVKRHLVHLYRKFGIDGRGASRQARLAAAALQRGAVSLTEVQRVA